MKQCNEHLGFALFSAAITAVAMIVGAFWPDPPVAGTPIPLAPDGGSATVTMTGLTPLKGEYPIHLQMTSGAELRSLGMTRNELLKHVETAVSYDDGKTFLRLPRPRATAYDDEADFPYLDLGSVHNPQTSTALVRVTLDAKVNWPASAAIVVKNDRMTHLDRSDSRETAAKWIIIGALFAFLLVVGVPVWLWSWHRRKRRAMSQAATAKVSCREDSKRLRRELENPRR